MNSALLDSSTENGGVCTNQPGDAGSVATGGGSATRPCAPSTSRLAVVQGAETSVSMVEYNELALKVNTIALETKNNTSDIQRLDRRVCDTEQENGRRHKWTKEEVGTTMMALFFSPCFPLFSSSLSVSLSSKRT